MRRLWVEARKHCGEHISWCGQGKVRTHKAGDFDFLARPRPEKRTLVLYAKLSHGSADAVKRVAGGKPRVVFSTHRHAAFLPLAEAASSTRDTSEKLEFLINSGQNVNERDSSGRSALLIATTSGNLSAMRTLLQHGADPWLPNNDGDLPWQVGDGPAVALLMEDPATDAPAPNRPDLISFPLHAACAAGDLARLKLLAPNADALRAKDAQDNTPLGAALLHGRLAIMESLLERGANPNTWVNNKEALLAHAVLHGQTEAVRLLLKYGAKPARSDRQGMPLLMRAMHAVHAGRAGMDLLKLVLETDAGRAALENALPLHYACHLADPALAQTLLESGADPSRMDGNGKSAADFVTELSRSRQNWDSFELKLAMLEAMQRVKAN
jgi:ankyrin repeat protein